MKREAQQELASRVVRLVRSGEWKKLRTHKDKSVYNYLTRNLQNRENMLARFEVLKQLGDEAPDEVKIKETTAQYEKARVTEKQTGRGGWLSHYDEFGQAWVIWDDAEAEPMSEWTGARQPVAVDIRNLQFQQVYAQWLYNVGEIVKDSEGYIYTVINRSTGKSLVDGGDSTLIYEIQRLDAPEQRLWVNEPDIKRAETLEAYGLQGGDEVVDTLYNIKGEVSHLGQGARAITVVYDRLPGSPWIDYPMTALHTRLVRYDASKHNPSDVPETPLRPGQIVTTGDKPEERKVIEQVRFNRKDGEPLYQFRSLDFNTGLQDLKLQDRVPVNVLNPDVGQIFKRKKWDNEEPTGIGNLFVRFLHMVDYGRMEAAVQTPFGRIRQVSLMDFEPANARELAVLSKTFDRVRMPQAPEGMAKTELRAGQKVRMLDVDLRGRIASINYDGTATVMYEGRKTRVVPLDQLTPEDEPVSQSGTVAYDSLHSKFVDVKEMGDFGRVTVISRSPDPNTKPQEYAANIDRLEQSSEEEYAEAAARIEHSAGDFVRVISTVADANNIGVVREADQFTQQGVPIYEIAYMDMRWGKFGDPYNRKDIKSVPVIDDNYTQIIKLDDEFSEGDVVYNRSTRDKVVITGKALSEDGFARTYHFIPEIFLRGRDLSEVPDADKKSGMIYGALLERPIEVEDFADKSKYVGKFVDIDAVYKPEQFSNFLSIKEPGWVKKTREQSGSKNAPASNKYVIIGDVDVDENKNAIRVRFDQVGGHNMWSTYVDADTFRFMTQFMYEPSDIVYKAEQLGYDPEKSSFIKDSSGKLTDYRPVGTQSGLPVFSITPFFKVNIREFREGGEYEKNAQSYPEAVAVAMDEILMLTAHSVKDKLKFTQMAEENGYINTSYREMLDEGIRAARRNMFNGLSESTIMKLYDKVNLKAQFATALMVSADIDKPTSDYAGEATEHAQYSALGKVLADKRTYEKLFDPTNKIVFARGEAGDIQFAPYLRGRQSDGRYVRTSQMMMLSSFLELGSKLEGGDGIKAIGESIPFEGSTHAKLKKLLNYMLGYISDENGNALRSSITGAPELEVDSNGVCPAASQSDPTADPFKQNLQNTARVLLVKYDSSGRPMDEFLNDLAEAYPNIDVSYLRQALWSIRDNQTMPGDAADKFDPIVLQAIEDRDVSPNGDSLLDMLSPAMDRQEKPWKRFAPNKRSISVDNAADALISKTITLDQAKYLSDSRSFETHLLTRLYNKYVSTEVSLQEFLSNMDSYIDRYGLGGIIDGEVKKALISSPSFLRSIEPKSLYELFESGAYIGVDLQDKLDDIDNYRALQSVVDTYHSLYLSRLSKAVESGGAESEGREIPNDSISRHVSHEAFKDVRAEKLRSIIFQSGTSKEQQQQIAGRISKMILGDVNKITPEYGTVEPEWDAKYSLFDPVHHVFDMDGKLWPEQFSYLSDDETQELYKKVQPAISGISDTNFAIRKKAVETSKHIKLVSKALHADIYRSMASSDNAALYEKMYKLFTGDLGEAGGSPDDRVLVELNSALSTIGYLTQDQMKELARIFENDDLTKINPSAGTIVLSMVSNFVHSLTPDEIEDVAYHMRLDNVYYVKRAIEDAMYSDNKDRLMKNIQVIEKDPVTNQPLRDQKGEIRRKLDLPSMNQKQLEKSLGIAKDKGAQKLLQEFLGDVDGEEFRDKMQRLQDDPELLDQMVKLFLKPDTKEDRQIAKALEVFDSDQKGLPLIHNVMYTSFYTGIVPPATGYADGIAGSIPHATKARYFYIPGFADDFAAGSRVGDHLGPEFTVSHIVQPDTPIDLDDVGEYEASVIREAWQGLLVTSDTHDNNTAWFRGEFFKVNDGEDDHLVLGVRELQVDGVQKYSRSKTNTKPENLKEGDHVFAYDPESIRQRRKIIDEIKALIDNPDNTQEQKQVAKTRLVQEMRKAPAKIEVVVKTGGLPPHYEHPKTGEEYLLQEINTESSDPSTFDEDTFSDEQYHSRKMDEREQAVLNEMKKIYHAIYRSIMRSAVAAGCDRVYMIPSWVASTKPDARSMNDDLPVADWRDEVMGTYAQQTMNAIRETRINEQTGETYTEKTEVPAKDKFGNEIWQARGVAQPLIDGYDNTAKDWGFTLQNLDHFWQTDPYWGYKASMLVTKAWVFDLKNPLAKSMAGRRMARKKPVRQIIAQVNQAGEGLAAYLKAYFAIQMRDGQYTFDKSKQILQEAFFMWLYDPSNRGLTQEQIKGAIEYAGAKIGIDMSEINDPSWKFGEMPQQAYDLLMSDVAVEERNDRPPVEEVARHLEKIMLDLMPNMMSHPEYRHLSADEIPIQVAKDLLNEPAVFPWSAVRDDIEYRYAVLRAVSAFNVSPERENELSGISERGEFDPLEQAISEEPTSVIEEPDVAAQIANQIAQYLQAEGDSYANFLAWIDVEAPELHANNQLRSEVLSLLQSRGLLAGAAPQNADVPSVDDLEQLFRESRRVVTGKLRQGDRVEVYAPVVSDVRAKALAAKRARGRVYASTNAGYVVEFDDVYDERILNSQRWLFGDVHLLRQGESQ